MVGDLSAADAIVAPSATPQQELAAARRALAAKQSQEREMTAAFGRIVAEEEEPTVQAARAARSEVRQQIGDLAALIHELEQQVADAYDREQRTNARAVMTAAEQFDVSLTMLLAAMKSVDAAGRAMYETANKHRDARATALLPLTWDTGTNVAGFVRETLERVLQQRAPWAALQPSLVDAARSRSNLIDWEN